MRKTRVAVSFSVLASLCAAVLISISAGGSNGDAGAGNIPPAARASESAQSTSGAIERGAQSLVTNSAVGLAIQVDNGVGVPLQVKRGHTFYLNQIDLRTVITANVDEGVDGLSRGGDFASFDWRGIRKEDQVFVLQSNPDGTFRRRQFFRGARWMIGDSTFELEQFDRDDHAIGERTVVHTGGENRRRDADDFFDRRIRAIQWANDCRTSTDCNGAIALEEEALVELRNAMHPDRTFTLSPLTTALRLHWSLRPEQSYAIPLTQVAAPPFAFCRAILPIRNRTSANSARS